MRPPSVAIAVRPLPLAAAGELLTLQRAAYVTEAQLYDDPRLPALTQSLDELVAELADSTCTAAYADSRLVGAVRMCEADGMLHIGRLTVVPDLQGHGIGSRLLAAAEADTELPAATLFTGHLSAANLRLYQRHGYAEISREVLHPGLELIHLSKTLAGHDDGPLQLRV